MRARRRRFGRGELVLVTDDAGISGVGEASPLPGYSPDTLHEAQAALDAWQPVPWPEDLPIREALARTAGAVGSPAARFAIETALMDLLGRRRGHPVHRLLGGTPPGADIPVSWLLPPANAETIAAHVRRLWERGIRHVKLKVGADHDLDLARLAAVRRAAPDVGLRLDAGCRLPVTETPARLGAYARFGVALVEEPCPPDALATLPRLPVPVALDESLQRDDAEALARGVARAQPLAAFVLKPTALGGFLRCLDLARLAEALGAAPIVTHTFDGPVAMAAAAELTLALAGALPAGLAPHERLETYPVCSAAAITSLVVRPHDAPGLGLAPEDPSWMR